MYFWTINRTSAFWNRKYFSCQTRKKKHDTMFDVGEMGHRDEVLPYYKLLQRIIHVIIDS